MKSRAWYGILALVVVVAALFQIFWRYDYLSTSNWGIIRRVDRLTGSVVMLRFSAVAGKFVVSTPLPIMLIPPPEATTAPEAQVTSHVMPTASVDPYAAAFASPTPKPNDPFATSTPRDPFATPTPDRSGFTPDTPAPKMPKLFHQRTTVTPDNPAFTPDTPAP
jgi:hypothetical protein